MKQSLAVLIAFILGAVTFAQNMNKQTTTVAEAKIIVDHAAQKGESVEGFLLEKPKFDDQTKMWQLKISVRKNAKLENSAIVITLPASRSAQITRYYQGDYVKLKNVSLEVQPSLDTASTESSEDLASQSASVQ